MNTAHTPGPWKIEKNEDGDKLWIVESNGDALCQLTRESSTFANARLIAAVPELRAALEWAETLLEGRLQPQNIIRTAIAKAKGGAS